MEFKLGSHQPASLYSGAITQSTQNNNENQPRFHTVFGLFNYQGSDITLNETKNR
eukprot:c31386_g1_i1 orf=203-367(-)